VQNGALIIGLRNFGQLGTGRPCLNGQTKIKVFVSAASIESITATDAAKVFTQGRIYPEGPLFLTASNSALIDANVSVGDLNSFASSSGTIILAGFAERHAAKAITGGRIIADELETLYGFFDAEDNGSISATVFEDVSAVAKTGGSIGFGGGANIISSAAESGGTITEIPDSGGNEGGEAPKGDGLGDGNLPDGGAPPADGGDEGQPADGGDEGPEQAVCGNALIEAPEECELDASCAADEECSNCECIKLPGDSGAEPMPPEDCTTYDGTITCAERPACPYGMANVGNVESDGLPCICCVVELK
jgi:hypothetical protein